MKFHERCETIKSLFMQMQLTSSRTDKEILVSDFRKEHPELSEDLNFCFEVLAGRHKLGYTYEYMLNLKENPVSAEVRINEKFTIKDFVNSLLKACPPSEYGKAIAVESTPGEDRRFISWLVNRLYKLGYSNKEAMVDACSPMLAKKYPETFLPYHKYYVQEKLDGNRCIAYYDFDEECWKFKARSGKPLKVDFNMDWAEKVDIFDGEVMTAGHAGSRDFTATSGLINSKYGDKSKLHYFIYDIVNPDMTYEERKQRLDKYAKRIEDFDEYADYEFLNCTILKVIGITELYPNPDYNTELNVLLDNIVNKGGEGLILRDPNGYYECGKRSNNLLKYKKTQTMDLRVIGWNEGNGKYEGAIGSFVCENDEHTILVNVAGMSDDIRWSDPNAWIGKIIEVAYFDISQSKTNDKMSLRFPRLKRIRNDKDTTSVY